MSRFSFYSPIPISESVPAKPQYLVLIDNQIQLRFLNPNDYDIVKELCEEWFPVEYPAKWFEAITSDTNLFSLAAILDGRIIGLIVAELKQGKDLNREDRDILCESQIKYSAAYILSLGVVNANRRQGIASLLLSSLLNHLSTLQCKAVFLHVLTCNEPALHFYEKHRFRVHKFLPYYYSIGGRAKDGFTYVLYLNGGHGPWGLQEYINHFCQTSDVISSVLLPVPKGAYYYLAFNEIKVMSVKKKEDSLVIRQISDSKPFPDFSKPEIIGCFSLDSERQFIDGPKYLKFCKVPESRHSVNFNLDKGCTEVSVESEDNNQKETSELVQLLRWINLHSETFERRRPNFVLYRGLMSKILGTPYEDKEGWTLAALWKSGTIYLRHLETAESIRSRAQYNANPRLRRIAAWGRRFEDYVLAEDLFGKPNPSEPSKEECNVVYLAKLNNHRILYAAELDGVWSKDGNDIDPKKHPEKLPQCSLVEVKTTRMFPRGQMTHNFKKFNLRKWWCQSFTAKISDIIVGLRDDEGVVQELQVMPLNTLTKMGQGWTGTVCFNFLDAFLTEVKNIVKENPNTIYVFKYDPQKQRNMDCMISFEEDTDYANSIPNLL